MSIETPLGGMMFTDPFPHYTKDCQLWLTLFEKTYEIDRYLYGILLYLRGVGAVLQHTDNPKVPYKIIPIVDKDRAWSSIEEWEREKKFLVPHTKALIEGMKLTYEAELSMPELYKA